jgi:lysophospholipase L1-like esterase
MSTNIWNTYRIVVLWDSIVEWAGSSDGKGWVGILREKYWSQWIRITNLGIWWNTTLDILNRLSVVSSYNPERIVLAVGINDTCIQTKVSQRSITSIEDLRQIFWEILHKCWKNGTDIRIIWLTLVDESRSQPLSKSSTWKSYFNDLIRDYDIEIKNIAKDYGYKFISPIALLKDENLVDGLHPNDEWYHKLADYLDDFITWN